MQGFKGLFVHLVLGLALCVPASLQAAGNGAENGDATAETHFGYPQDWSSRHLVMTGDDSSATLKAGITEPRHVYNMVMRRTAIEAAKRAKRRHKNAMKVDWAVSLENGFVPADQSPAKYGFDVTKQSCNNDFVLLGLTVVSGPRLQRRCSLGIFCL